MATVVLAIGAITVLSRQRGDADRKLQGAAKAQIVKARLASQDPHLDGQSGQGPDLTAEEAKKLAGGLKELVNQLNGRIGRGGARGRKRVNQS